MPEQPEPTQAQRSQPPKRRASGKLILLIAAGALVLFGLHFVPAGASSLAAGDCFHGNPLEYPASLTKIDCHKAAFGDWKAVFSEKATGSSYPGNIEELRSRCKLQSGFFPPSDKTWGDGDRTVICATATVPE